MVSVKLRMVKLRTLLTLKLGPGAAILPPEITRIHMDFAVGAGEGHYGPRKFWRTCLRRLKYYNPTVSTTVTRSTNQEGPATMTIHFSSATSTPNTNGTSLPPPALTSTASKQFSSVPVTPSKSGPPVTRVEEIDMKNRSESEILNQLMALTQAQEVKPTPEELRMKAELEEGRVAAEASAARRAADNEKRRQEKALWAQAAAASSIAGTL